MDDANCDWPITVKYSKKRSAKIICVPFSDFDKRVNDNKTAAEDAMRRIPEINATINEANDKTRRAEAALGNAANDAKEAKAKAEEAEKIANDVQKVRIDSSCCFFSWSVFARMTFHMFVYQGSAKTKEDAEKAFEDTMKLDGEVNGMMDQLAAAEKELEEKKKDADNDMMMANMVRIQFLDIKTW